MDHLRGELTRGQVGEFESEGNRGGSEREVMMVMNATPRCSSGLL